MGADGGTIPKRCELVRSKKKVEKVDKATKNATKWKNCQLTQNLLKVGTFLYFIHKFDLETDNCGQIRPSVQQRSRH